MVNGISAGPVCSLSFSFSICVYFVVAGQIEFFCLLLPMHTCTEWYIHLFSDARFPNDSISYRAGEGRSFFQKLRITGAKRRATDYQWMRFLAAGSREEFEKMAGEDNYINEAYEVLQKLSAD